jgi:hypothetical protein
MPGFGVPAPQNFIFVTDQMDDQGLARHARRHHHPGPLIGHPVQVQSGLVGQQGLSHLRWRCRRASQHVGQLLLLRQTDHRRAVEHGQMHLGLAPELNVVVSRTHLIQAHGGGHHTRELPAWAVDAARHHQGTVADDARIDRRIDVETHMVVVTVHQEIRPVADVERRDIHGQGTVALHAGRVDQRQHGHLGHQLGIGRQRAGDRFV